MGKTIPRNLEALIKTAAIDPGFRDALLKKRSRIAEEASIVLEPSEREMLDAIPEAQLLLMIRETKVTPREVDIVGPATYKTLGILAIGGAITGLLALFSSGSDIKSIFGGISGTLGHRVEMAESPEPLPADAKTLKEALATGIKGLSFDQAVTVIRFQSGMAIGFHGTVPPEAFQYKILQEMKGNSLQDSLYEVSREFAEANSLKVSFGFLPGRIMISISKK